MALLDEFQVGVDGAWGDREAAHLLRRAGYGGSLAERMDVVGAGTQQALVDAVDGLVNIAADDPFLDQPATGGGPVFGGPFADMPDDGSYLGRLKRPPNISDAVGHWLYRMRHTSQPLQEQLALFLHDHMVSESGKLGNVLPNQINYGNDGSLPGLQECSTGTLAPDGNRNNQRITDFMLEQNYLFRETGIDDFRELLINITRNRAMLIYLDNVFNVAGRPQENYSRELMELFSMGVGNYNENDVKEIAKCFTGETFPNYSCPTDYDTTPGFLSFTHEPGNKFVFGQTINADFSGQETIDVIDLLMSKVSLNPDVTGLGTPYDTLPATSVYVAWKLLRWFVSHNVQLSPVPGTAVLELADYLRGTDNAAYPQRRFPYDIRAALRKIFLSKYFYDDANVYTMYKTPAEFVISILKGLEIDDDYLAADGPGIYMLLMGMRLFDPPNVAGWNHGTSWINSGNLVVRFAYAFRVAYAILLQNGAAYVFNLLADNGGPIAGYTDHEGLLDYFATRLLQDELTTEEHDAYIAFLENVPPGQNDAETYGRKALGLVHLLITVPRFQLK